MTTPKEPKQFLGYLLGEPVYADEESKWGWEVTRALKMFVGPVGDAGRPRAPRRIEQEIIDDIIKRREL